MGGLDKHSETASVGGNQVVAPILESGQLYHVQGWNYKAQFILGTFDVVEDWAYITTPKTKKRYVVPASRLFYAKKTKRRLSQQLPQTKAKKRVRKNATKEQQ